MAFFIFVNEKETHYGKGKCLIYLKLCVSYFNQHFIALQKKA